MTPSVLPPAPAIPRLVSKDTRDSLLQGAKILKSPLITKSIGLLLNQTHLAMYCSVKLGDGVKQDVSKFDIHPNDYLDDICEKRYVIGSEMDSN